MELFDLLLYKSVVGGDPGGGGGSDVTLETLNVSRNGTINAPDGTAYNKVVANVPNTYAASDNGKVVRNGALVAQTAHAEVTQNGTIDTTLNNSVVVNVPMKEALSWHQCPEAVRNYLANVDYTGVPYTQSSIETYAPNPAVPATNTKPIGETIDGVTYYNTVPNADTPFATANKAGTLNPLDHVRWIKSATSNMRDLGGWACDGGKVKYGMMFRGGKIGNADLDVLLNQLHLRYELDLRGTTEAATAPSPLIGKIGYSVFDSYAWYSIADKALWKKMLRVVFDCAVKNEPMYFHCTAGADRTGTLACIIEALLGMSQSDIDKDYELTSFYSGTADDNRARRRNEADWTGLIGEINAYAGNTFRDKAVNFVASLGFTAAEINAFRAAMIDGTPETVTPSVRTFTIAKTLAHTALSNAAATATEYQPYETDVTPNSGYVIADVSVTMGGTDITNDVWSGEETALYRSVSNTLVNCSTNNAVKYVVDGNGYAATITADEGYTLDGAAVTITMGGINVSQYYSNGTIAIPQVTGDIAISITAVESVVPIVNLIDTIGIAANTRLSTSDGGNRTGASGYASIGSTKDAAGMISIAAGDTIRISGMTVPGSQDTMCALCLYSADGTFSNSTYFQKSTTSFNTLRFTHGDILTITATTQTYFRLSLLCSDTSSVVVTRNQEIT